MRGTDLVSTDHRQMVARRVSPAHVDTYETRGLEKDGVNFPIEVRPLRLPYPRYGNVPLR